MNLTKLILLSISCITLFSGCGDDPSSLLGTSTPTPTPVAQYTVGGTVSGLSGTVVLQNNAGDNKSVAANGAFTFATSINDGATYAITVLTQPGSQTCTVTSGSGTVSGANVTTGSVTCVNNTKKIFITHSSLGAGTYDGNLGGPTGADAKCMSDSNYPGSGTFKAMLTDGSTRIACTTANCSGSGAAEHTGWVLAASTAYYRVDGTTLIGTTNAAGIFSFPLTNSFSTAASYYWSSLNTDWTVYGGGAVHCTGWTTNSSGNGEMGDPSATDTSSIKAFGTGCNGSNYLLCVQQ